MAWKEDVISRLRAEESWSSRSVLITLWELWRDCDVNSKNQFEAQRADIKIGPADAHFALQSKDDLIDELLAATDWEFVVVLGKYTARLELRESAGIDFRLRPVQPVYRDRPPHYFMIRRPAPVPDHAPRVLQGKPLSVLFRNLHIVPDTVGDGIKVKVEDHYPPLDGSGAREENSQGAETLHLVSGGYRSECTYARNLTDSPRGVRVAYPRISEGGEQRLATSIDACAYSDDASMMMMFPELSIDKDISRSFARSLRDSAKKRKNAPLRLVCPGTYHHEVNQGVFRNRAQLFDVEMGTSPLWQEKMRFFKGTKGEVATDEDLQTSDTVRILPTRFGTVCMLICRDFGDESELRVANLLDIDIALVPSMGLSSTASAISRAAAECCRQAGTSVVFAMQTPPDNDGKWAYASKDSLKRVVYTRDAKGDAAPNLEWVFPPGDESAP